MRAQDPPGSTSTPQGMGAHVDPDVCAHKGTGLFKDSSTGIHKTDSYWKVPTLNHGIGLEVIAKQTMKRRKAKSTKNNIDS